jgi:hypothetical protein
MPAHDLQSSLGKKLCMNHFIPMKTETLLAAGWLNQVENSLFFTL